MNCTDKHIIELILTAGRKAETQAVICLKKCETQIFSVLRRIGLTERKEITSLSYQAMAEFIIQVRKGRFTLTDKAKICTYVTEIAKRKQLGVYRKDQRYANSKSLPVDTGETKTEAEKEREDQLHKALLLLKENDRQILTAFYFYDQPLEEYAISHEISYEAAKQRLSRARKRLKELFQSTAE